MESRHYPFQHNRYFAGSRSSNPVYFNMKTLFLDGAEVIRTI